MFALIINKPIKAIAITIAAFLILFITSPPLHNRAEFFCEFDKKKRPGIFLPGGSWTLFFSFLKLPSFIKWSLPFNHCSLLLFCPFHNRVIFFCEKEKRVKYQPSSLCSTFSYLIFVILICSPVNPSL